MFEAPSSEILPDLEIREKLRDPNYLPTHADFHAAFPPTEQGAIDWQQFCNNLDDPVFEFITEEFIIALAYYIKDRIEDMHLDTSQPVTVLEVGAGDGRISKFLQEKLDEIFADKVRVVATSTIDGVHDEIKQIIEVENLSSDDALAKYNPTIAISCWMPGDIDFTEGFRKTPSIQEYLLIGEAGGCCGDLEKTWGFGRPYGTKEPWEEDGFSEEYVRDVSEQQISRLESPKTLHKPNTVGGTPESCTLSFRRK